MPAKPIYHLPVGSSIERQEIGREEARNRLGIAPEEIVLGVFGTLHVSRLLHLVRMSAERLQAKAVQVRVLYIGPQGDQMRNALGNVPLLADGALAAPEVSRRLAAMDIYLAPYIDGVSTRRSAMMAALQHAIPVVGTVSYNTDVDLVKMDNKAIYLAKVGRDEDFQEFVLGLAFDPKERQELGQAGLALFERRFSWPAIVSNLLDILRVNSG